MSDLTDMKRTKAEKESRNTATGKSLGGDDYPYGLELSLGPDELSKLGIKTLPAVGSKMKLRGHAHVTSVSEDHSEGSKKRRNVRLQLRKLALDHAAPEDVQAGAKAAMDKALGASDGD